MAYRKNFNNLYRFALQEWPQAYTQYSFVVADLISDTDEWKHYFNQQWQTMLEECAGFFLDWGFYWVPYYQMVAMSIFMIFGPFLMMFQTYKTYLWYQKQTKTETNKVEEDDDFERDDSVAPAAVTVEESKGDGAKADKKND